VPNLIVIAFNVFKDVFYPPRVKPAVVTAKVDSDTGAVSLTAPPVSPGPAPHLTVSQRLQQSLSKRVKPTAEDYARYKLGFKHILAITLATLLTFLPLGLQHMSTHWAPLTAGIVFQDNTGSSLSLASKRLQGVVIGATYGFLVITASKELTRSQDPDLYAQGLYTPDAVYLTAGLIGLFSLFFTYTRYRPGSQHYASTSAIINCIVIAVAYGEGKASDQFVLHRLFMTLLGVACAMLVTLTVWPQNATLLALRRVASVLRGSVTLLDLDLHFLQLALFSSSTVSNGVFGPSLLPAIVPDAGAVQLRVKVPRVASRTSQHHLAAQDQTTVRLATKPVAPFFNPFSPESPLRRLYAAVFPLAAIPRAPDAFMAAYDRAVSTKLATLRRAVLEQQRFAVESGAEQGVFGGMGEGSGALLLQVILQQYNLLRVISRMHECVFLHQRLLARLPRVKQLDRFSQRLRRHYGNSSALDQTLSNTLSSCQSADDDADASAAIDGSAAVGLPAHVIRALCEEQRSDDVHFAEVGAAMTRDLRALAASASHVLHSLMIDVNAHIERSRTKTTLGLPCSLFKTETRHHGRGQENSALLHRSRRHTRWWCSCFGVECGGCCESEVASTPSEAAEADTDIESPPLAVTDGIELASLRPVPAAPRPSPSPAAGFVRNVIAATPEAELFERFWAHERLSIQNLRAVLDRLMATYEANCRERLEGTSDRKVAMFPSGFLLAEHAFIYALGGLGEVLMNLTLAVRAFNTSHI
jgi:hypothetical protein